MNEHNISDGNQTASVSQCTTADDFVTSGIPELSTFGKILVGTVVCILIVVGFCGNLVVCFIVYRKPQMRSAINLLLANMALSDILVSVLCMPLPLTTLLDGEWIFRDIVCKIHAFLFEYLTAVATFILFIMSGDRYTIIVKRRDKLTVNFAKVLIAVVWTIPLVITLAPALGLSCYKIQYGHIQCILVILNRTYDLVYLCLKFTVNFLLPILLMGYIFVAIGNTVRVNSFRVRNHSETEVSLSIAQMSAKLGFVLIPMKSNLNIDVKFKTRTFKTIMLLYFVVLLCLSPYCINQLTSSVTGRFNVTQDTIILWIAFSKSAFNPVIYFFRIKKFREACREFLPEGCKCKPDLGGNSKRRVNPSAAYEYHGEQSVTTTAM